MEKFRQIHENDIREGFVKASFKGDKISVHYEVDRRDTKEVHKQTIHDPGAKDLYDARRELAGSVIHLMGLSDFNSSKVRLKA